MKSKIHILVFLIAQISFYALFGQEKEVVKVDLDTVATLHWGQVSIPMATTRHKAIKGKLTEFQSLPQNYLPIDLLISSLRERIFLYENNNQIFGDIKTIKFTFTISHKYIDKLFNQGVPIKEAQDRVRANNFVLTLTADDLKKLPEEHIQKIIDKVKHRTNLYIDINNGLFFSSVFIRDKNAPYEAPTMVYQRPIMLMDFQLLEPLDGPIILRIDTTSNHRLFNYYKNDGQTEIIHIPNFKTTNSTVDEKNEQELEKILGLPSSYPTAETLDLPEYTEFLPKSLKLQLGQLVANPDGDNIPLTTFLENKGKLSLWQKATALKIKAFRLIIFDKENKPKIFWIKNLKNQKWQHHFDALDYENAIFFDKIIMEKDKKLYYLGQPFLFKIGKAHLKN